MDSFSEPSTSRLADNDIFKQYNFEFAIISENNYSFLARGDTVIDDPHGAGAFAYGDSVRCQRGGAVHRFLSRGAMHHIVGKGRLHEGDIAGPAASVVTANGLQLSSRHGVAASMRS